MAALVEVCGDCRVLQQVYSGSWSLWQAVAPGSRRRAAPTLRRARPTRTLRSRCTTPTASPYQTSNTKPVRVLLTAPTLFCVRPIPRPPVPPTGKALGAVTARRLRCDWRAPPPGPPEAARGCPAARSGPAAAAAGGLARTGPGSASGLASWVAFAPLRVCSLLALLHCPSAPPPPHRRGRPERVQPALQLHHRLCQHLGCAPPHRDVLVTCRRHALQYCCFAPCRSLLSLAAAPDVASLPAIIESISPALLVPCAAASSLTISNQCIFFLPAPLVQPPRP